MFEVLPKPPPKEARPPLLLSLASDRADVDRCAELCACACACEELRRVEDEAGKPRASDGSGALRGSALLHESEEINNAIIALMSESQAYERGR